MRGEFVNPFAPYGYKRDEKNKRKLVIDERSAAVVQDIFRLKIEGLSKGKIAAILNDAREPSPADYKKRNSNYKSNFQTRARAAWTAASVGRILANPIYTGVLIQGRYTTPNYKIKKRIERPDNEWRVVSDAHEAIIDEFEFKLVSDLLKQDNRVAFNKESIYPLSGYVYCADCGDSMVRQRSSEWIYLVCASSRRKGGCSSHCIRTSKLEAVVLEVIKRQIALELKVEELSRTASLLKDRQINFLDNLNAQICDREKEILLCEKLEGSLHEDYKTGIITKEDFIKFNKNYKTRISGLKLAIDKLRKEAESFVNNNSADSQWLEKIMEYKNIKEVNRHIVVSFVERIEVFSGRRVAIKMRWQEGLASVQNSINNFEAEQA